MATTLKTTNDKKQQNSQPTLYDKNTDYMAIMQQAANSGDYLKAARAEQQRNAKIAGEGIKNVKATDYYSSYLPENRYVYDPNQNAEYSAARAQQNALFEKIMNREPFQYNAMNDPLYRQYRDQYTALGKTAMRDTMGQAAALTGGYGSTYAQQAGQQSYGAYMQRLNDVLPELYNQAYNRYQNEQNALINQYGLVTDAADTAYNRDYNQWANRLNLERADEEAALARNIDAENQAYNRKLTEDETAYARQQDQKNYLVSLISTSGYQPTDAELKAAGMTRGEANAWRQAYLAAASNKSGGSGGGRSSGGRSSGRRSSGRRSSGRSYGTGSVNLENTGGTPQKTQEQTVKDQCALSLANMKKYGGSKQEMRRELSRWVAQGLPESEANRLAKLYGLDQDDTPAKGGGKTGATGSGSNKINVKGSY